MYDLPKYCSMSQTLGAPKLFTMDFLEHGSFTHTCICIRTRSQHNLSPDDFMNRVLSSENCPKCMHSFGPSWRQLSPALYNFSCVFRITLETNSTSHMESMWMIRDQHRQCAQRNRNMKIWHEKCPDLAPNVENPKIAPWVQPWSRPIFLQWISWSMGASSTHAYVLELAADPIAAQTIYGIASYLRKTDKNVHIVLAQVDVNFPGVVLFLVCVFRITLETSSTGHVYVHGCVYMNWAADVHVNVNVDVHVQL